MEATTATTMALTAATTAAPEATTPIWATIVVAVVAGVFGLLAGASAAAIVTARHQRNESFRTRMIEAADMFMRSIVSVRGALEDVSNALSRFGDLKMAYSRIREIDGEFERLDALLPPLYVLFATSSRWLRPWHGQSIGEQASVLRGKLCAWREELMNHDMLFHGGIETEMELAYRAKLGPVFARLRTEVDPLRDKLLRDFSRAIRRGI